MRRGELKRKDAAIVIGYGPVGRATISILKARGVNAIVASDFSPGWRTLAANCGADVVINPADGSPYANRRIAKALGGVVAGVCMHADRIEPAAATAAQ